jgi:hypothetical protein
MNQRIALRLLATSLSLSVAIAWLPGCSSDDSAAPAPRFSCAAKGPCANDPTPSTSEAQACQALATDSTCGAAFQSYSACAFAAAICTDAGLSDPTGDSTGAACNGEFAAYTTCLENKINDAGASD